MRRGFTGHYETTSVVQETIRAFIPKPLPPEPALELSDRRQRLLERATATLGRLEQLDIVHEITAQQRSRVFAYYQYLSILNEGMEE